LRTESLKFLYHTSSVAMADQPFHLMRHDFDRLKRNTANIGMAVPQCHNTKRLTKSPSKIKACNPLLFQPSQIKRKATPWSATPLQHRTTTQLRTTDTHTLTDKCNGRERHGGKEEYLHDVLLAGSTV
jgi:hypothetical protein